MSAIEEHKEKRRALGRGLDSLLPSGPRLATAPVPTPAVMQSSTVELLRQLNVAVHDICFCRCGHSAKTQTKRTRAFVH